MSSQTIILECASQARPDFYVENEYDNKEFARPGGVAAAFGVRSGQHVAEVVSPSVSDWVGQIKKAWAKGPASTLELARIVSASRNGLPHGGWTALW